MFDIGWSEILVIAVVAIVVVGPKELPRMLRTFGKTMGTVRRTANDFRRQFDEALREAEREVDLADTKKELQSIARLDPIKDAQKDLDASLRGTKGTGAGNAPKPVATASIEPAKPAAEAHPAEPLKTGVAGPQSGADAA